MCGSKLVKVRTAKPGQNYSEAWSVVGVAVPPRPFKVETEGPGAMTQIDFKFEGARWKVDLNY